MISHMWEIKKNSKEINGKWKQTLGMQKTEFIKGGVGSMVLGCWWRDPDMGNIICLVLHY